MSMPHTTPSGHALKVSAPSRHQAPRVEAFGLSDMGVRRTTNEDSFAVLPDLDLFMVADGMGGAAAGEVASRMAIDAVSAMFQDPDITWPRGLTQRPPTAGLTLLAAGIEYANARVHAAAVTDPSLAGMGTTIAALLVRGDTAVLAHVGDSRIYGLRGRRIEQLTTDHTLTNALVQAGVLTQADAATSEVRHMLSRAIGTDAEVEVDVRVVGVHPGDTFLLATDGLHGVADDETIAAILLREQDLTAAAARLIERANELGGPDNTSVVLVRVSGA